MRTSTLLRKAKRYLWDGVSDSDYKPRFICLAISLACGNGRPYVDWFYLPICKEIHKRMEGAPCLEYWLNTRHGIRTATSSCSRIQAYRKAWLNELIREYAAKGD